MPRIVRALSAIIVLLGLALAIPSVIDAVSKLHPMPSFSSVDTGSASLQIDSLNITYAKCAEQVKNSVATVVGADISVGNSLAREVENLIVDENIIDDPSSADFKYELKERAAYLKRLSPKSDGALLAQRLLVNHKVVRLCLYRLKRAVAQYQQTVARNPLFDLLPVEKPHYPSAVQAKIDGRVLFGDAAFTVMQHALMTVEAIQQFHCGASQIYLNQPAGLDDICQQ